MACPISRSTLFISGENRPVEKSKLLLMIEISIENADMDALSHLDTKALAQYIWAMFKAHVGERGRKTTGGGVGRKGAEGVDMLVCEARGEG